MPQMDCGVPVPRLEDGSEGAADADGGTQKHYGGERKHRQRSGKWGVLQWRPLIVIAEEIRRCGTTAELGLGIHKGKVSWLL